VTDAPTGFLLIDKPSGWTSHDVVAWVRRLIGGKVGHAGTLDPMATGLLVLGLGRSTRLLRFVQGLDKEYEAGAVFGVATDTLDADGAVLSRAPMPITEDDVRNALARFRGEILQVPPMVSARRIEGRRLYEIAREGGEVERDARPVAIYELELLDFAPSDYPEIVLRVVCSTGTYVRTLADDVARALGGRAHLNRLRRVRNGSLNVADAVGVEHLEESLITERLLDPATALIDLPAMTAGGELAGAVRHGVAMPRSVVSSDLGDGDIVRVLDDAGSLLAVYRLDGASAKAEVVTA